MKQPLKVLIVEDSENDAFLLLRQLRKEGFEPQHLLVEDAESMAEALESESWDLILSDYNMPQFSGPAALKLMQDRGLELPFIVISGEIGEAAAIETMRAGAHDYLMKGHLKRLGEAIRREMKAARERAERKQSEKQARKNEERLRALFDSTGDFVMLLDCEHRVQMINRIEEGLTRNDVVGTALYEFVDENDKKRVRALLDLVIDKVEKQPYETTYTRPDGSTVYFDSVASPVSSSGEVIGSVVVSRDVTERRHFEAQLAQSDRLASMGMLAAGIAHEINNPLAYILYNLESATTEMRKLLEGVGKGANESSERKNLMPPALLEDLLEQYDDALVGAHRIRDIARGLGTFSRVERNQLAPVDLRQVIEAAVNMAFNEIKYRARFVKDFGEVHNVMASDGRLAQVFLNLIINATHAIDDGDFEGNEIMVRTWTEGDDACAEVRDTGCGIDPNHLDMLFEPFFTTKEIGTGSGLGLAISKNIVEGYGGTIEVVSEVGRGTSFTVRIPFRREVVAANPEVPLDCEEEPESCGRILVVDDDSFVRAAIVRMLSAHEVLEAVCGETAREILAVDRGFDLILCDVMMPEVSGIDLHEWLVSECPELADKVVFVTGGAFTPRTRDYLKQVDNLCLEKPLDERTLSKTIRDAILAANTQA